MNKFTKIAISLLLIISIILNPLGSVFDIRAGAVAPILVEFGKQAVVKLVEWAAGSVAVYLGSEAVKAGAEAIEAAQVQEYNALNALER